MHDTFPAIAKFSWNLFRYAAGEKVIYNSVFRIQRPLQLLVGLDADVAFRGLI